MEKITIIARQALTPAGWRENAAIDIAVDGRIAAIRNAHNTEMTAHRVGVVLPAPGNAHSHSFQRAMAGLSEYRGANPIDDFWTWRTLMYRFVERLTPDDIETIAAQTQMEMLEAGYASSAEFHYLHHQPDGAPYDRLDELGARLFAAASETGIGYTHLPVLYMRGGMDDRPLAGGQRRFGCTRDQFAALVAAGKDSLKDMPDDCTLGVAPHSLRAVGLDALVFAAALDAPGPIHIHAAEQTGEVEEARNHLGARPVEWLLDNARIDARWNLVHATHMTETEIAALARSGAAVVVCPITESNLGDGIFSAPSFLEAGGRVAIGSDSDIRISLTEELRTLEHSQRLRDRRRVVLADATRSCGRFLLDMAARGGAGALGRNAGRIEIGALADLVALNANHPAVAGLSGDRFLDAWIFAGGDDVVTDVWAAGRHMVKDGRHINRARIAARYNKVIARLRDDL